jgi:hypothetical protein
MRKAWAALVGAAVVGSGWLAAPAAVAGATLGTVSFPVSTYEAVGSVDWGASGRNCDPGETDTAWMTNFYAPGSNTWPPVSNFYGYRASFGDNHGTVWSGGPYGCRMHNSSIGFDNRYRFDPVVGNTYQFLFIFAKNTNDPWVLPTIYWVNSAAAHLGDIQELTDTDGGTGYQTVNSTAPAGAIGVGWEMNEAATYQLSLSVEGLVSGGDCLGVGSMAFDTVEDGTWGEMWATEPDRCVSDVTGDVRTVTWEPASNPFAEGDGYCFIDDWVIGEAGAKYAVAAWVTETGTVRIYRYNTVANEQAIKVCMTAPPGVVGVRYIMESGMGQESHTVADATADELVDCSPDRKFQCGGGLQRGVIDHFADCEIPEATEFGFAGIFTLELANPVDYIPYGICLMVAGFSVAIDWLSDIYDTLIASAGEAVGGLADGIGDVLEALFVPVELGEAWDAFVDELNTHVPFSWVGTVSAFLVGGMTGGNLAGASVATSMSIMGATVAVDFGSVFGELGWLRTVLMGVIYLGCGFAIWRMIGRTLGGQG